MNSVLSLILTILESDIKSILNTYSTSETSWPVVDGQRCLDSVRICFGVVVSRNLKSSVGKVFECPNVEFEPDFDRHSLCHIDRTVHPARIRRRLLLTRKWINTTGDKHLLIDTVFFPKRTLGLVLNESSLVLAWNLLRKENKNEIKILMHARFVI